MGSPISLLAEIYMNSFENKLFNCNNKLIKCIHYWTRYVDDIFCIWTGNLDQLSQFLLLLNSFHDRIQFTMELEDNNKLNFLDIQISKLPEKLDYNIFRKPTCTDTIIPSTSNQSMQIKLSVFHSMIHRLLNFPLNENNYNKEVNIIKQIAINNGYKGSLIDRLIKNKEKKMLMRNFYNNTNSSIKPNFKFINYCGRTSIKVCNNLNKLGVNTISVNKRNIGKMLVNNKEKTDKLQKTGVYKLSCKDCDAIYIGQTGRNIKKRIDEHKKSIIYSKNSTGMAAHCIQQNHFINLENVKLLHSERKGKRLDYLEQLEIKRSIKNRENIVNEQQNFINTPFIDVRINTNAPVPKQPLEIPTI